MVANLAISKTLRFFEKYLIEYAGYQLGVNYDLILLIPEYSTYGAKYSWLISAQLLDDINQRDFIQDVLGKLKQSLSQEEYLSIARVNKLNSANSLIKDINFLYPFDQEITEINDSQIRDTYQIERAILLRSRILSKIRFPKAVTITLIDGKRINAGIISIDENFIIKHWTGKGLRELFAPDRSKEEVKIGEEIKAKGEEYLIAHQYISFTNLDDIEDVY